MPRKFLDIDPTIIEKNLLLRGEGDDELSTLFPQSKEECPSKLVLPSPGFCVKTRDNSDRSKAFINVCQTSAIPSPDDLSEEQLAEILGSDAPTDFRVPMSIGEAKDAADKQGERATEYDVAINPDFFKKVDNNALFKQFFIAVAMEGINQKYNVDLNMTDYAILKNKKVWGTLQTHRVQQREINREMRGTDDEKPLIEELGECKPMVCKTLNYRFVMKNDCDDAMFGEFFIPDLVNLRDLSLHVGEDRVVLNCPKLGYNCDVFLPKLIHEEQAAATFTTGSKFLTITMPLQAE